MASTLDVVTCGQINGYNETEHCFSNLLFFKNTQMNVCHAVAYLVEALCYKPEGRGFESR
jgi:hypothetical protein